MSKTEPKTRAVHRAEFPFCRGPGALAMSVEPATESYANAKHGLPDIGESTSAEAMIPPTAYLAIWWREAIGFATLRMMNDPQRSKEV
jgi:hypothetical protein